ncbi:MAG: CHAD domain-containing protein [Anaerolineae bacterium]|nr:CHAD domain-containing protein [Anaerolineae bacterium]
MAHSAQSVGTLEHTMEIEAKFSVTDDALAEQLRTIERLDSWTLARGAVTRVHDVYLDTSDRRLLAAGYACRQRRIGRQRARLITLKRIASTSDAIHARDELEITVEDETSPAEWQPSPARDVVLQIIGDASLEKLFELRQTRVKRNVMQGDTLIAEWSVDVVSVRAGKHRLNFAELEIERVAAGTLDDVTRLATRVQAEWNLAPVTQSKFERALAWLENSARSKRQRTPKIRLDDTMAEAARKTLRLHWNRMLEHEAGARAGVDSEEVHDMRVATRRMRAALRVFDEFLDADAFKPFAKRLRRTARALGAVRDLDVFREKTQRYLATLPDERRVDLEPLWAVWQSEYQRARAELLAWLDSEAYTQFKTEFDEFLRTPGAGAAPTETEDGEPRAHRVRDVLPMILLRAWADVHAYAELVTQPNVSVERLHQLRIAAKGLRYTLEFFADVLGEEAQPLIGQIRQLQDHLGNLQDAVVACNHLRDFLTWGEWTHPTDKSVRPPRALVVAPGVAAYLAARQNEIHTLIQTFPNVWSPIQDATFKRKLLTLLAAW